MEVRREASVATEPQPARRAVAAHVRNVLGTRCHGKGGGCGCIEQGIVESPSRQASLLTSVQRVGADSEKERTATLGGWKDALSMSLDALCA